MNISKEIERRLAEAFAPERLEVENESAKHAGHAGDDGTGESHFRVTISAPAFAPMSRIERHRAIHAALGPQVVGRIHALALHVNP